MELSEYILLAAYGKATSMLRRDSPVTAKEQGFARRGFVRDGKMKRGGTTISNRPLSQKSFDFGRKGIFFCPKLGKQQKERIYG